MAIIKYSESIIDKVYTEKNDMLKEVASNSIYCAKCGELLENDIFDESSHITCKICGYQTPKIISKSVQE